MSDFPRSYLSLPIVLCILLFLFVSMIPLPVFSNDSVCGLGLGVGVCIGDGGKSGPEDVLEGLTRGTEGKWVGWESGFR